MRRQNPKPEDRERIRRQRNTEADKRMKRRMTGAEKRTEWIEREYGDALTLNRRVESGHAETDKKRRV